MATCRPSQAQYPVYTTLISGVNLNNNGYRRGIPSALISLLANHKKISSTRAKHRDEAAQTVFRESETQTDPFAAEIKRPFDFGLEVLTLSWLSWKNGLPAGMREVTVIERARQKRAWARALPPPFNAAASEIQNLILEAIELNEWNYREVELAALSSIRMELAKKCMHENLAMNRIKYENRLFSFITVKSEEKEAALMKARMEFKRSMRRLTMAYNNVNRKYYRWNVLKELDDKTSELYGPQQRFGVHPRRAHEVIPNEFRYWNVFSSGDVVTHKFNMMVETEPVGFDYVTKSKPREQIKQICVRETKWTLHELENLFRSIRSFRYANKKKDRKNSCTLRQRIEHKEMQEAPPAVTAIPDEEEDAYQASVMLQKLIKGRAIQAVMFEGRARCQELIDELTSTHALQDFMESSLSETKNGVYAQQRRAEMKALEEQRKNEILVSLEGKTVAEILDFLSKELLRIQDERKTHAMALMADRARHEKEAAEAGRRQKEDERSREHTEMWRQTCKAQQNSLDLYLEETVDSMKNQFISEEARREATEYAKKVDQAAMEAHLRKNELEQEEIVADLVYNFALPEAEKEMVRARLKQKQKTLLTNCHNEIYSQIEMAAQGKRSPSGQLLPISRAVERKTGGCNFVTYLELNKVDPSVSYDETSASITTSLPDLRQPDDEWSTGFTPKDVLIRGYKNREEEQDKNVTKRVLAPFLARYKKKSKLRVRDVKEEFRRLYQEILPGDVLSKLAAYFKDSLELSTVLNETCVIMKNFTQSEGVFLYLVDPSTEHIVLNPRYLPKSEKHSIKYPIEPGTTVAAYVAYAQEFVASDNILGDPRFPLGIPGIGRTVKSVLCLPVLTCYDGETLAVIELFRSVHDKPYTPTEIEMAVAITGWMGSAIHQNNEKLLAMKENELTKHVLNLLQLLFSGVIPFDKFVSDIVIFTKMAIGAERGSFYRMEEGVVEGTKDEILAASYEEGIDNSHMSYRKKIIERYLNNSSGIAGYVARTGKPIILQDAYADARFNRAKDTLGYRTRTLIAVPIKSSLNVYGVLQLTNKFPYFTERDSHVLQSVACYALLACQFEQVSNNLRNTLDRYNGNLELVKVHVRPCPDDLDVLASSTILKEQQMPRGYFGFDWFVGDYERDSPQYAIFSICHCLGNDYFDYFSLSEFVLMVKKSYRANPYHNFVHAFTVFHCAFNIINKNRLMFTTLEKAAFLVSTLCHDSDHFGYTNSFLSMTNNWLANLYEESSLEHHHFDMCMMLIEITDLFSNLTAEEFRELKRLIESLILSTDLANHFKTRGFITNTVKNGTFDWSNDEHRLNYMHVIMTCCDISGQCKPFPIAKYNTECLYQEFYRQGAEEKAHGVTPLSMMDRMKTKLIPTDQIHFLTIICIPCLEVLVAVLPNTEILLEMCINVREEWKMIKREQEESLWWPEASLALDHKPVLRKSIYLRHRIGHH